MTEDKSEDDDVLNDYSDSENIDIESDNDAKMYTAKEVMKLL